MGREGEVVNIKKNTAAKLNKGRTGHLICIKSNVAAQQCTDLQILEYYSTKGQLVCCETLKGHIDGNTKEA